MTFKIISMLCIHLFYQWLICKEYTFSCSAISSSSWIHSFIHWALSLKVFKYNKYTHFPLCSLLFFSPSLALSSQHSYLSPSLLPSLSPSLPCSISCLFSCSFFLVIYCYSCYFFLEYVLSTKYTWKFWLYKWYH